MSIEIFLHSILSNIFATSFQGLHLSTPKSGEMKDPGNEVEIFLDFAAVSLAALTRLFVTRHS